MYPFREVEFGPNLIIRIFHLKFWFGFQFIEYNKHLLHSTILVYSK